MTPTKPVLAMEVSQRLGGVAIRCPNGEVCVQRLTSSTRRGDALMPAVEALMAKAGMSPRDLGGVGVSIGPGGFTGLRIGIAVTKMLAFSLDIPIAAVPTALVAAECASSQAAPLAVALASKDDTCWLSLIEGRPGARTLLGGPPGGQLVDPQAFVDQTAQATCVLADEHLPAVFEVNRPRFIPDFDPTVLLHITERMLAAGEIVDPLELALIYPRRAEAVRIWEARQG